jgi:hypothetical protein
MAFKMKGPMFFKSALKHYPKGAGVHGHKDKNGDTTYHGESKTTGKKNTYDLKDGTLVKNPVSRFGQNKFDE